MNKVLRLQTGLGYDTPVDHLLKESGQLSVNQLIAYTTISTTHKIVQSGEPCYLAERLKSNVHQRITRRQSISLDFKLSRGREGFLYWGKMLYNALPNSIKIEKKLGIFKKKTKKWVSDNIPSVPKAE
jgi:hypothetical protein